MIVKLLTEHHLEFLSLKGGCRGSSETHVKMPHCLKSHAVARMLTNLPKMDGWADEIKGQKDRSQSHW